MIINSEKIKQSVETQSPIELIIIKTKNNSLLKEFEYDDFSKELIM